ncbi:MAG: hypothetical protein NZ700_10305 [Gemmataceae bacterium]|nr:hypothetical protein [Gemmataceae bacterium]MDW8265170.1 hypothetical protein [Gemmataceae bacterium]
MKPVRVKVYGLVPITRRTYVTIQSLLFGVVTLLLAIVLMMPRPAPGPENDFWNRMFDFLPWVIGAALVLEAIETLVVLRQFRKKEAELHAPLSNGMIS